MGLLDTAHKFFGNVGKGNFFRISVEKKCYFPGEQVKGELTAVVKAQVLLSRIDLVFFSRETTSFDRKTEVKDGGRNERISETKKSLNVSTTLHVVEKGENLPLGEHTWPFSIDFPKDHPSTFNFHEGDFHASVQYFIRARAICTGPDLTSEIEIIVVDPPPFIHMGRKSADTTIISACCRNKGSVGLGVTTAASAFVGKPVALRMAVDNRTDIDVSEICVELHQRISATARGNFRRLERCVARSVYRGIGPRQAIAEKYPREEQFIVPGEINPSIRGLLVVSSYHFRVLAKTKVFCSNSAVLIHKIHIARPGVSSQLGGSVGPGASLATISPPSAGSTGASQTIPYLAPPASAAAIPQPVPYVAAAAPSVSEAGPAVVVIVDRQGIASQYPFGAYGYPPAAYGTPPQKSPIMQPAVFETAPPYPNVQGGGVAIATLPPPPSPHVLPPPENPEYTAQEARREASVAAKHGSSPSSSSQGSAVKDSPPLSPLSPDRGYLAAAAPVAVSKGTPSPLSSSSSSSQSGSYW